MITFLSKFERLGYNVLQCLVWAAISETGIYFRDTILLYLSGLFRILVLSEGLSPLALSWYRESRDAVRWP
jgi:hypothetical protein